jgi:hypothetical protein
VLEHSRATGLIKVSALAHDQVNSLEVRVGRNVVQRRSSQYTRV